jgi:hypothetical protein
MSRTRLYQLLRLPGAPAPKADGRWDVEAIREFALRSAAKLRGPEERDKLQVELLNLRIKRAAAELSEFQDELRNKICDEYMRTFEFILRVTKIELHRVIDKLGQHFNNREICKLGRALVNDAFRKSVSIVQERTGVTPNIEQADVVIPFVKAAHG